MCFTPSSLVRTTMILWFMAHDMPNEVIFRIIVSHQVAFGGFVQNDVALRERVVSRESVVFCFAKANVPVDLIPLQ